MHMISKDSFLDELKYGFQTHNIKAVEFLIKRAQNSLQSFGDKEGFVFNRHMTKQSMAAWLDFLNHAVKTYEPSKKEEWVRVLVDACDSVSSGCCVIKQAPKWKRKLGKAIEVSPFAFIGMVGIIGHGYSDLLSK